MGFFSNIFSRSSRVVRGQLNTGMDAIEDATFESTLRQTVRDMKTELNQLIRTSADAMSNYNRLESEYQKYVRQSEEWKERAKQAIEAGREELAKKALVQKSEADKQIQSLQSSVDSAHETSDKLKSRMNQIKQKISEAERNAATLIARKNAARAQKKVAAALAGLSESENAFSALSKFEESVAREEAQAAAFEELASGSEPSDSDLIKEFDELGAVGVDDELAALKKEMGQ